LSGGNVLLETGGSVQGKSIGGKCLNTNSFKESATASYSIRINDYCTGNCPGKCTTRNRGRGVFKGKVSGESVLRNSFPVNYNESQLSWSHYSEMA